MGENGTIYEQHRLPGFLGVVVLGPDAVVRYVSPDLDGRFGLRPDDVVGRSGFDLVHPDDLEQAITSFSGTLERPGHHQPLDLRIVAPDGTDHLVAIVAENLRDELGVVAISIADTADWRRSTMLLDAQGSVMERIALGGSIDEAHEEILSLLETALPGYGAAIHLPDPTTGSDFRAHAAARIERAVVDLVAEAMSVDRESPQALAVAGAEAIVAADLDQAPWRSLRRILAPTPYRACWSIPIRHSRHTSALGCLDVYVPDPVHPRPDEWSLLGLAARLVAIAHDHARMRRHLERRARIDPLTGTHNRQVIEDVIGERLTDHDAQPVVLFVDLDRLKLVNDSLGHVVGDAVISAAGERLADAVGDDGIVGRFGGDEFVVVAELSGSADDLAIRCLDALAEPCELPDRTIHISASIGVVVPDHHGSATDVLRDADAAMYEAKRRGRSRHHVFGPRTRDAVVRRLEIEGSMREMLRDGDLDAAFQPIIDLGTGELVGAEALARWHGGAELGVSTAELIEVAEESGMIIELGRQMIARATRAANVLNRTLARRGRPPVTVAVNVSPRQFGAASLLDVLSASCAAAAIDPSTMCLEITESLLMLDSDGSRKQIEELRSQGTQVAIDDFGTGYSSLAYLQHLPVHCLKIDRRFVQAVGTTSGDAVLRAIVAMAVALGVRTVAEGVERLDDVRHLRELGIDAAQGFALSKPMLADELVAQAAAKTSWIDPG